MKSYGNLFTWSALRAIEEDLRGALLEIRESVNNDNFPGMHRFVRGKLVRIAWKNGRPAEIFFSDARESFDQPRRTRWYRCDMTSFICNIRTNDPPIRDNDYPAREHAWKSGKIIVFVSLDDDRIALFLPGQKLPSKPYFYRTIAEQVQEYKDLIRAAFGI